MGKFERNDRGGSRFGSNRGGRGDRKGRGDRGERPSMHDAVCDDCGKKCQVPFRPTGDKPIYCSDCFSRHGGGSERSERRSGGNRSFSDRGDRQKFEATCAKCGKRCEVPFRPTGGKPVYCNDCFDKGGDDNRSRGRESGISASQLSEVNAKLDRILKLLTSTVDDVVSAASKKEKAITKTEDEIVAISKTKVKKDKKTVKAKPVTKKKVVTKKKK